MMKRFWTIASLFLSASIVLGQTAPTKPASALGKPAPATTNADAALPTKDEVEVAMKRTFGYDPSISWTIYDINASPIPGVADVMVSIKSQAAQHIYFSSKTQTAIVGEVIPFGPNPFAPTRAKLQAADGPALVTGTPVISMVEFSDLECPHCKAAEPVLEKLNNDFPQVRFVFQQFPLPATMHPWALQGAKYSDCVGRLHPAMFWKYIDAVFEGQGGIAAATAEDKLKEIATSIGLDAQKISACASLPETDAIVKKSVELGQSLDVTQTPTLFVNGRRVLSIADVPYEQLKRLVQFEIDHANR
jgi:protein-disulfide isomerase